jgi:hypothetical protein
MSTIITENFKILLAKQAYNLLEIGANSYLPEARKSYVYCFFGKQLPWNAGTEVPSTPSDTITYLNDCYKRGILAKRASIENASLVVPRINWTSNTVYNTYESNTNFYVLNSKDQVFKCLYNNSGITSTSEPELTLSTTSLEEPYVKTSDGYKWKYMMTLTSVQKQKFLTDDWMPVVYNKFVRSAAEPGSIDVVSITNSGNNYTSGSLQDIITIEGDGTGAVLKANISSEIETFPGTANVSDTSIEVVGLNTYFLANTSVGSKITIDGQEKTVVAISSNTILSVDSIYTDTANNMSITKKGGKVLDIIVQNRGKNYTYANLSFTDVSGGIGSGAAASVSISPVDGHGYDPVFELGASTLMFNVEFEEDESGILPTDNDFREIILVHNPQINGTTTLASDTSYTLYTKIKVSPGVGDFSVDEVVYQGPEFSSKTFSADVISFDTVENYLYVNNVKGTLSTNQALKGYTSGSIRIVNSITNPTIKLYSGKILYISDKLPISRDAAQTERIRFILSF